MESIGWTIAAIISGCMLLVGIGVLFVRAKNIERRWVVALPTLLGAGLAIYMLSAKPGLSTWALVISLLGFAIGRVVDVLLGPMDHMPRDPATYGADLAD